METHSPSIVRTVVIAVLAFVLVTPAWAAFAQQQPTCGPAVEIERKLASEYKESPRWVGRLSDGSVLFLVGSEGGETWTIYRRLGDMACLVAGGVDGQFIDAPRGETF